VNPASPFEFGVNLRVRGGFEALRDRFARGEVLVCWQVAWSRYDGVTGYFFRQHEAPDAVRAYDVADGDEPAWAQRFDVAAPAHPLIVAARAGEVAEGVDVAGLVGALALEAAIDAGQQVALQRLLARASAMSGATRLRLYHHAARSGKAGCVGAVLAAGLAVDAEDGAGQTALIAAVGVGDLATARVLLDAGADPRHSTSTGVSAVSLARAYRHEALLAAFGE
jgi:ankyrin repeat protein